MKKFFKGLGSGLMYFGIYLGAQIIVSFAAVFISMFILAFNGGMNDPAVYAAQLVDMTLKNTMLITLISNIVLVGVIWIIFLCRKKKFLKEIEVKKISPLNVPVMVIAGCAFNIMVSLIMGYLPIPQELMNSYAEMASLITDGNMVISFISAGIIGPIAEEIIFRGLMFTRFKSGMPVWLAAVLSSLIFGLMHGHIVWSTYAFILGLVFCWFFSVTKSLWGSIILHLSFNSINYALAYLGETTFAVDMILLGASIAVMLICVVCVLKLKNAGGRKADEKVTV